MATREEGTRSFKRVFVLLLTKEYVNLLRARFIMQPTHWCYASKGIWGNAECYTVLLTTWQRESSKCSRLISNDVGYLIDAHSIISLLKMLPKYSFFMDIH